MGSSRWDVVVGLKYSKWSLANQTSVVLFLDCRQFCMAKTYGSAQWRATYSTTKSKSRPPKNQNHSTHSTHDGVQQLARVSRLARHTCTRPTCIQGLAVWRGAQARCDFAEALRFPAVLQCGAQQILQILLILLPSD